MFILLQLFDRRNAAQVARVVSQYLHIFFLYLTNQLQSSVRYLLQREIACDRNAAGADIAHDLVRIARDRNAARADIAHDMVLVAYSLLVSCL